MSETATTPDATAPQPGTGSSDDSFADGGPLWLDDQEQRAWRGLLSMYTQLMGHLRRSLQRDSNLSDADYEVLVHLSEAEGDRLRVFELVRALQWEKSRLSHHLRRMEGRELVERSECETDGRGAYVQLTTTGRAAIEAAAPRHVAEVRRHFADVLDPAQLAALAQISDSVLASLSGSDDCPERGGRAIAASHSPDAESPTDESPTDGAPS